MRSSLRSISANVTSPIAPGGKVRFKKILVADNGTRSAAQSLVLNEEFCACRTVMLCGRVLPRVFSAKSRRASLRASESVRIGKRPIARLELYSLSTNVLEPPCETRQPKEGSDVSQ